MTGVLLILYVFVQYVGLQLIRNNNIYFNYIIFEVVLLVKEIKGAGVYLFINEIINKLLTKLF